MEFSYDFFYLNWCIVHITPTILSLMLFVTDFNRGIESCHLYSVVVVVVVILVDCGTMQATAHSSDLRNFDEMQR